MCWGEYGLWLANNMSKALFVWKTNDVKLKNNMEIRIIIDLDKTEDTYVLVRNFRGRYVYRTIDKLIVQGDNLDLFYIKNKSREKSSEQSL